MLVRHAMAFVGILRWKLFVEGMVSQDAQISSKTNQKCRTQHAPELGSCGSQGSSNYDVRNRPSSLTLHTKFTIVAGTISGTNGGICFGQSRGFIFVSEDKVLNRRL
jgi:hypothetical protein